MSTNRELPAIFDERVVVFDGATGSLLFERGVSASHPFEELNLSTPYMVCQAHADYLKAGADIIETNTFAANRFRLSQHGLEDKVCEINAAGAKLARDVGGTGTVVAGSVGPFGVRLAPIGPVDTEEVLSAIKEQVKGLVDGGVDLILLETQTDLQIMRVMVEGVLAECELPVMCQFAVGPDLTTPSGDSLDDIVVGLSGYPISALGVNCRIGPEQTLNAVRSLREITQLPISAQPNSGFPTKVEGRTMFQSGPSYFAERGKEMVEAGASAVGGCCGTTPAHIEALAKLVKAVPKPAAVKIRQPRIRPSADTRQIQEQPPVLRKMNGDFVTVEVTPPKDTNYEALVEKLRPLVDAGISAINVTDNPMAHVHMSALAFAHLAKRELGVATILHVTCRDLNLLGMHSMLLGAAALGTDAVLALTGDPATLGDYPDATSVYDVTSDGLIKIITGLNNGTDYSGKEFGKRTSFGIGAAFSPGAEDIEKEIERLKKKREAGIDFLMTQPVFDLDVLRNAVDKLPDDWQVPVLVGIIPLRSSRHAEFLHNEIPGIDIPEPIRTRLASCDKESAREVGVEIAREVYNAARRDFAGSYFIPPFNNYDVVRQVIAKT